MPEKTKAIILNVIPYRESSVIVHVFTERFGLLHGIAKGIKSKKKSPQAQFIERGFVVELFAYIKPHRELHLVTSITVLEFFAGLRLNLYKTAIRDAAFEIILKGVGDSHSHPELYSYLIEFLSSVEHTAERHCFPFLLWQFCCRFSQIMGYGPVLQECVRCQRALSDFEETYLIAASGGVVCKKCLRNNEAGHLPAIVRLFLNGKLQTAQTLQSLPAAEVQRITFLLAYFCGYHFEVRSDYRSLEFFNRLFQERISMNPNYALEINLLT